jgi:prepilin-type N-terminal cleavage/methylation domain-containing protein
MMNGCSKKQSGFTLVELVVVVAILGTLSVVSIPKIIGLTQSARYASLGMVATSLTSASMQNYMIRGANNLKGEPILLCTGVGEVMHGGTTKLTTDGYIITEGADALLLDTAVECNISTTGTPVLTLPFSAIRID